MNNTIVPWRDSIESWQARACYITGRNLTREERARFIRDEDYRTTYPNLPKDDNDLLFPWIPAPLPDHATERVFLRKVGGGYIFVHRLLIERFAAIEQAE